MRARTIVLGGLVAVASFAGVTLAMQFLWPTSPEDRRPALVEVPPLPSVTSTSEIVVPTAIALSAIRDRIEGAAPRSLSGKRDNPVPRILSNADLGWSVARDQLAVSGRPDALVLTSAFSGTFRVTGQIAEQASNLGNALGGLIGGSIGQQLQNLTGKAVDQQTEIRGNVNVLSRPVLASNWRLDPSLSAQVSIADAAATIAGIRIGVSKEVKPFIERAVNDQLAALGTRLRADPFIEVAARREWSKICRSIPLAPAGADSPVLWLEMRPTKAFAGQPRIDAAALTLTIGVLAETRIVPAETKPDCPFPSSLEIVSVEQEHLAIAVPIDLPFPLLSRLLAAQLAGKSFPNDGRTPYEVTILGVALAASGDRLLISLHVKAREKASWFGFGAEANVHIWGRPVLDSGNQTLRLADVALDVDTEAAFGLLGAAARAAIPYLTTALSENAVIDLKPFAANARKRIEDSIASFRTAEEGVKVDTRITDLRLGGIEFDGRTLRVRAEAAGSASVAVTALPVQP
jgi:hypothetical protein